MKIRKRDIIKVAVGATIMTGGIMNIGRRQGLSEGFDAGRVYGHKELIEAATSTLNKMSKKDKSETGA